MPTMPRDYSDLFLAPVALSVDERLQSMAGLDRDELHQRVVLVSNDEASTRSRRARDVVQTAVHLLDLHGWRAEWDPRGVRLSHDAHSLVLGVPESVRSYVAEPTED